MFVARDKLLIEKACNYRFFSLRIIILKKKHIHVIFQLRAIHTLLISAVQFAPHQFLLVCDRGYLSQNVFFFFNLPLFSSVWQLEEGMICQVSISAEQTVTSCRDADDLELVLQRRLRLCITHNLVLVTFTPCFPSAGHEFTAPILVSVMALALGDASSRYMS